MMGYYMPVEDPEGRYIKDGKNYRLLTASCFDLISTFRPLSGGKGCYNYPAEDWYYFDNEDDMTAAFGIKKAVSVNKNNRGED